MMLYLFDLDGTLISGYMDNPDKDYDRWRVLPGRVERLAELREQGHTIRIITNQGGVAFGFVTEEQMMQKLGAALLALGLQPVTNADDWGAELVYVCCHDPRGRAPYNDPTEVARRKPSGAMIGEAIRDCPWAAPQGVLMIGDRPEDEQAARAAAVSFLWAHEFFGC